MVKISRPIVKRARLEGGSTKRGGDLINSNAAAAEREHDILRGSMKPVTHESHVTHNVADWRSTLVKYGVGGGIVAGAGAGGTATVLNFLGGVKDDIEDGLGSTLDFFRQQLTEAENAALGVMHGVPSHISGITDGAVGAFTGNVTTVLVFGLTVFMTYELYRNFS
jgi:hypothetical protein